MFPLSHIRKYHFIIAAICLANIVGCSASKSGATIDDFEDRVRQAAGPDAENCGNVAIDESRLDTNTCLANAFSNSSDAYAIFMDQGIDSQVASGTVTHGGTVTFYFFDSDPTGGGALNNGQTSSRACEQPQLSGSVDVHTVFNCIDENDQTLAPLIGTVWLWSSYSTASGTLVDISPEPAYFLQFSDDPTFAGYESCNAFSGMWIAGRSPFVVPESISVDDGFCESALTDAPDFLQTLAMASLLTVSTGPDGDRLFVDTADGTGISLIFTEGWDSRVIEGF